MAFYIDLSEKHRVVSANAHYYPEPTPPLKINRTLLHHDLIYLLEGHWAVTENEKEYFLSKGDVLLLTAGQHHYTRNPCEANTRTFCVHITGAQGDFRENNEALSLPTLIHAKNHPKIMTYFSDMVSYFWSDRIHREEELSALIQLLFWELLHVNKQSNQPKADIAAKAIDLLNINPGRYIQAGEAAEALFVSVPTLNEAMKRKMGVTFSTFQRNKRLEMVAHTLLAEPDAPLKEIANHFGFYDEFHLSKAFKAKYDVSPKEFRASN